MHPTQKAVTGEVVEHLGTGKRSVSEQLADSHDTWSDYRRRVARTDGLDAQLNEQWNIINGKVNGLLEQLFAQNAELEFIRTTDGLELADPGVEVGA